MPLAPAPPLAVTEADRKQLVALSRQRSIPRGTLLRVNVILGAAEGRANHLLARDLSTTVTTVLLWRKRYETDGLAGLFTDRPRSGRPKRISDKKEDAIDDQNCSKECDSLECPHDGDQPEGQPDDRASHLEETQTTTASG